MVNGDLIGTNAAGTAALANTSAGVEIYATSGNTIGGTTAAVRDVISGGGRYGVVIDTGADDNVVEGDYIGTDTTGTVALGNSIGVGVLTSSGNTIGGTAPARAT